MKKYLQNIYCGIRGTYNNSTRKYDFTVDFDGNTDEDVVQFIKPYFTQSLYEDSVYWFGYRFNGKLDKAYRDAFIEYMKNVQEEPPVDEDDEFGDVEYSLDSLSEYDLNQMVLRLLKGIKLNKYNVDTIVYPKSASNDLVRLTVKCMMRYLADSDKLSYVEVTKADPKNIDIDIDAFLNDIKHGVISVPKTYTRADLEYLLNQIHQSTEFSLRSDIHPVALRHYVKNFLEIKNADASLENALNVLIVDDFFTTGTTISEIISVIRKYNRECSIYIFTLLGTRRIR